MAQITITEALAEIKTIKSRLDKKRLSIGNHIARDARVRDPLAGSGGEEKFVSEERQSIADLENQIINLRTAILKSNLTSQLQIGSKTRSVQEWLTWRREVSSSQQNFLRSLTFAISDVRKKVQEKGGKLIAAAAVAVNESFDPQAPPDLAVNIDERKLIAEQEDLEKTLGDLDGKLSLFNATTTVEA